MAPARTHLYSAGGPGRAGGREDEALVEAEDVADITSVATAATVTPSSQIVKKKRWKLSRSDFYPFPFYSLIFPVSFILIFTAETFNSFLGKAALVPLLVTLKKTFDRNPASPAKTARQTKNDANGTAEASDTGPRSALLVFVHLFYRLCLFTIFC